MNMDARVDISQFWPTNEDGKPASVTSVWDNWARDIGINRQTLTAARGGSLATIKVANLLKLSKLCSALCDRKVALEEIITVDENVSTLAS